MARVATLLRRRPRPSTLVLLALFGGVLALYVIVRPETVPTGGAGTTPQPAVAPTSSPSPSGSRSPSPEPSPSATDSVTPTESGAPEESPSVSPSSVLPLPSATTRGRR
jgi:hypothetical protein